ncbi:hypothetical protein L9F63_001082, partial [Diploptera punctata]
DNGFKSFAKLMIAASSSLVSQHTSMGAYFLFPTRGLFFPGVHNGISPATTPSFLILDTLR